MLTPQDIKKRFDNIVKIYVKEAPWIHRFYSDTLTHKCTLEETQNQLNEILNGRMKNSTTSAEKVLNMLLLLEGQRKLIISLTEDYSVPVVGYLLTKDRKKSRSHELITPLINAIKKDDRRNNQTFTSGLHQIAKTKSWDVATDNAKNFIAKHHWTCNLADSSTFNVFTWNSSRSAASWVASWFVTLKKTKLDFRMGYRSTDPRDISKEYRVPNFRTDSAIIINGNRTTFEKNYQQWESSVGRQQNKNQQSSPNSSQRPFFAPSNNTGPQRGMNIIGQIPYHPKPKPAQKPTMTCGKTTITGLLNYSTHFKQSPQQLTVSRPDEHRTNQSSEPDYTAASQFE